MTFLEVLMYELGRLFLLPVLGIILALFAYAVFQLGSFVWEARQRDRQQAPCPLFNHLRIEPEANSEALELVILKQLESLRIVSRTAPMLGLVATMIPLGPALLALGDGDLSMVGEQLVAAFAAVIIALMTASICYWILLVRRRWLLMALHSIEQQAIAS